MSKIISQRAEMEVHNNSAGSFLGLPERRANRSGRLNSSARLDDFVLVRPYRRTDLPRVISTLSFLPSFYPNANFWLERRLGDVDSGRARCTVISVFGSLAGIAIEVDKGTHLTKLCTFYVAPQWRSHGFGSRLLKYCSGRWVDMCKQHVYVTADQSISGQLEPLFSKQGFCEVARVNGRYAPDRTEIVFDWSVRRPIIRQR